MHRASRALTGRKREVSYADCTGGQLRMPGQVSVGAGGEARGEVPVQQFCRCLCSSFAGA